MSGDTARLRFVFTMVAIPSHSRLVMAYPTGRGNCRGKPRGGCNDNGLERNACRLRSVHRSSGRRGNLRIRPTRRRERSTGAPETNSELVAGSVVTLLQRVAGTSMQDIDGLISELQILRETLQEQGVRVQRNLAEYDAHLSQSAMQSTKIIAESLAQLRQVGDWSPHTAH